jgi:MoaA/NifB/PqqE/SkfB family radical SAM enzyme
MINLKEIYKNIQAGYDMDLEEFKKYVEGFEDVVLWGAGNLGKAIFDKFLELNLKVNYYWDRRASDIVNLNGIDVLQPFTGDFNKDKTLVIICISSACDINIDLENRLTNDGFCHHISGARLNEALICPFKIGSIIDSTVCLGNPACNQAQCQKYFNILKNGKIKSGEGIFLNIVSFILTLKCSLKCANCNQNNYNIPLEEKVDYELERIKAYIDNLLEAVDGVATITLIGGEPFLYPDLAKVVKHILTKENFGSVQIVTNGIWNVNENELKELKHEKVSVNFSDYTKQLTNSQVELFKKNVEILKKLGIRYKLQNLPWIEPALTLQPNNYTYAELIELKDKCMPRKICTCVKNGIYYPCAPTQSIKNKFDCVDIMDKYNLRERMRECINKDFYEACQYCRKEQGKEVPAGEQI